MQITSLIAFLALGLIVLRLATELWLARLNRRHVLKHANAVPEAFKDAIAPETYRKAVEYTLAKSRFGQIEQLCSTTALLVILFSSVLPLTFKSLSDSFGSSAWSMAAGLVAAGIAISLPGIPFDW